ncbi:MAG: ATP-dependent DNA helicase chl1 [Pleopsidium flavum]|nr:MAG: ATP-dependent DNA helicase chl1 [Pleopsidium flavum]
MELPKRDFHHPYQPYGIQIVFMNGLYDCIEDGKVGIFESPTENDEPEWMLEYARQHKRQAFLHQTQELETRLAKIRAREKRQRQHFKNDEPQQKRKRMGKGDPTSEELNDVHFMIDDYQSDGDEDAQKPGACITTDGGLSEATQELMRKLGMVPSGAQSDEEETDDELKIFYCSRTHSQLSQFINELRRVQLPPVVIPSLPRPSERPDTPDSATAGHLKHLTLGSRKNLCINPRVTKLKGATAINEKCLELQRPETPAEQKCLYLPTKDKEAVVNDFRDHVLAKIRDIEDLPALGRGLAICPYYASRPIIRPSEIVTLPYPLLLQKSAREALGLSLKGHVVIIDEAHNLMDAITSIHSITISLSQLKRSRAQLGVYLQRFRNRLKGKNRVYVTQVVRLLDSLATYLHNKITSAKEGECIVKTADLLTGKGVDQINLYKLMHYLQESKLARKVEGYIMDAAEREKKAAKAGLGQPDGKKTEPSVPVLTHIQGFLSTLTDPVAEGRFFFERSEDNKDIYLKYMLLDPTFHFQEIVEDARAVILAGGTMSPMSDYINRLFSYLPSERLTTLSCGHVIPPDNLIAWPVTRGPSGIEYDFTFDQRKSPTMIDELGIGLLGMCHVIPDGVVVFFPSYAYLDQVVQRWQSRTGTSKSMWDRLAEKKTVFRESKENASAEDALHQYSIAIDKGEGGLLLSVVGGKMSEGINFSDRLGRAVIVVGLPYSNIHSSEWKAKIEHVERSTADRGGSPFEAKAAGRELYENSCMRAVNQSIGRAIRHQNDYASILLLDRRYDTERIKDKLPGWIRQGLVQGAARQPFTEITGSLTTFFRAKEAL